MLRFGTIMWFQAFKDKVNSGDGGLLKRLDNFSCSEIYCVNDRPELKPIFVAFDNGHITEVKQATDEDNPEFRLDAPYEIWRKVLTGELDIQKAMFSRILKVTSSIPNLMKYSNGMCLIVEAFKSIETEW